MKTSSTPRQRLLSAVLTSAVLLSASFGSHAAAAGPTAVSIGSFGGKQTYASVINNAGQMVGQSEVSDGTVQRNFIWSPTTGMQTLPSFGGYSYDGYHPGEYPMALSETGQVISSYRISQEGLPRVAVWTSTLGYRDIGASPTAYVTMSAMNTADQIIGNIEAPGLSAGYFWDPSSGYREITSPFGYTRASGLNNRGQVVGQAQLAGDNAFIWDAANGMRQIDVPDLISPHAMYINDNGIVWGRGASPSGGNQAYFVWDAVRGARVFPSPETGPFPAALFFRSMTPTGILLADFHGMISGRHLVAADPVTGFRVLTLPGVPATIDGSHMEIAFSSNITGQATGYATTATGETHAFFFDAATGMTDLGTLPGDTFSIGMGINDRGQVVGTSFDSDFGNARAFVWDAASGMQLVAGVPTLTEASLEEEGSLISNAGVVLRFRSAADDLTRTTYFAPLSASAADTTAPVITALSASTTSIWPVNKKMVAVKLTATATDNVAVTSLKIISVTTNEPDKNTQWQITGALTLNLLADREGKGKGRIYTITVEAADAAGNKSRRNVIVTVPHDQGK